jgi:N-methylhydantoinase B
LDQDYEMFEQQTPNRLIKHEYLRDSAGPGRWRGGLGVETVIEVGADNTQVVVFGDGDVEPAFGVSGGGAGTLNSVELRYPDGRSKTTLSLDLIQGVPQGTVYRQLAGGGGGYGDPRLRPLELVAAEVRNGIISREAAREHYGVVLDEASGQVDEEASAKLRGEQRNSAHG